MLNHTVTPLPRELPALGFQAPPLSLPWRMGRSALNGLSQWSVDAAAQTAWRLYLTPKRHAWPSRERPFLNSADRFEVAGPRGRVACYSWGQEHQLPWEARAAQNTVLLVHGWEGRGTQMGAFVAPLVEQGFRVVAMDAPAHGASAGRRTNLFEFRDSILAVARHVGPLRAVVGHSFGGGATALALAQGLDARAAVVVGAPSRLEDVLNRYCHAMQLSPAVQQRLVGLMEERFGTDVLVSASVDTALRHLQVPGLIIHDVDDHEVPYQDAVRNAGFWKQARLVTTAGLGHRRTLRDGPVVQETVRFIVNA